MPEVEIEIGARVFSVACQEGEEPFLQSAAKMLDTEAAVVLGQIGRMPPERMLLMAGLMLADKTAALEDDLRELTDKVATQDRALRSAEERLADRGRKLADLQEVIAAGGGAEGEAAVAVPEELSAGFAELADRAETIAEAIETATQRPSGA